MVFITPMWWTQSNERCSFIDVLINIQPNVAIDNVYYPFMFAITWPKQATQSNTSRTIEILYPLGNDIIMVNLYKCDNECGYTL